MGHKKIVCPNRKCKSVNVVPLDKKNDFSLLGAAVGAAFGPLGALVGGVANGKGSKIKFRCVDCGTVFEEKV